MNLDWQIKIIDAMIRENPDATIRDFLLTMKEIRKIELFTDNYMIDFTSPLIRMPFGQHKGKVFWTIGPLYFDWLAKQHISTATVQAIEEARLLHDNRGCFAVIKRNRIDKYVTSLVTIRHSERMAKAQLPEDDQEWIYFIYQILDRSGVVKQYFPRGYMPGEEDYFYKPRN